MAVSAAPYPLGLTPCHAQGDLPASGRFRSAREASPGRAVPSIALADGGKGQEFFRYHRANDTRGARTGTFSAGGLGIYPMARGGTKGEERRTESGGQRP